MKHYYFLLSLLCSTMLLSSCNKADNLSFSTVNSRIKGKWKVEKVCLKTKGDIGKDDISENYKNIELNFMDADSLTMYVPKEDITYPGYWYVYEHLEWDEDEGEYDTKNRLYMILYDPYDPEQLREFYWKDIKINSNKFEALEVRFIEADEYKYFYKLIPG